MNSSKNTEKYKPLVSIGIPVYNGSKYLSESINSLINQSYKNIEIIISDNCSIDETENICKSFSFDKRVKYHKQIRNIGALNNFNYVLNISKGNYFMWAAHDDLWDKEFITKSLSLLKDNNTIAAMMKSKCGDSNKNRCGDFSIQSKFVLIRRIKYLLNPGPNCRFYSLYKKEYLQKVDISEYEFFAGDWAFIYKLLEYGNFNCTKDVGFYKRVHDKSASETKIILNNLKNQGGNVLFPLKMLTKKLFRISISSFLIIIPILIYQNYICLKWFFTDLYFQNK